MTIEILKIFLKFRLRQIQREAVLLGILYSILLAGAGFFLFYLTWQTIHISGKQYYAFLCLLPALMLYTSRKDEVFLKKLYSGHKFIFLTEYLLLSLPFLIIAAVKDSYYFLSLVVVCCVLMAMFPVKPGKNQKSGQRLIFIPPTAIEWKSGLRKLGSPLIILWLLSVFLSPFPAVSIVLLWVMHSLIISFYQSHEGRDILRVFNGTAEKFIFEKIKSGLTMQFILQAIPCVFYLLYHPEQWWVLLFILLHTVVSLSFSIIVKYAFLDPENTSTPSTLYQSIGVISFLVPFILPLPLFLGMAKYKIAIMRLNSYGVKSK